MKRSIVVLFLSLACVLALGAQVRLDIGVDVPKAIGAVIGNNITGVPEADEALSGTFFPFPEASLHYVFGGDFLRFGVGVRTFTFIIESVAWPNVFVEAELGPVVLEAQAGGGAFALYGLANQVQTGQIFIPDLSAWFKLGKVLRLGGGAIGLYMPEILGKDAPDGIPFAFYFGGKLALTL